MKMARKRRIGTNVNAETIMATTIVVDMMTGGVMIIAMTIVGIMKGVLEVEEAMVEVIEDTAGVIEDTVVAIEKTVDMEVAGALMTNVVTAVVDHRIG